MSTNQIILLLAIALISLVCALYAKRTGVYADIHSRWNIYIRPSSAEMNSFNSEPYRQFCLVMYYCVVNCYKELGLMYPYNMNWKLFVVDRGRRIYWKFGKGVGFILRVQRDIDSGGIKHPHYTSVPLDEIKNKLNLYFQNFCCDAGLPPYRIEKCEDGEKGRILVYITYLQ